MRSLAFIIPFLLLALSGCEWADEYMPVIGERCEHWQCFTESGREASDMNIKTQQQIQKEPPAAQQNSTTPLP